MPLPETVQVSSMCYRDFLSAGAIDLQFRSGPGISLVPGHHVAHTVFGQGVVESLVHNDGVISQVIVDFSGRRARVHSYELI